MQLIKRVSVKVPAIPKAEVETPVAPAADSFQRKSIERIAEKKKVQQKVEVKKEVVIEDEPEEYYEPPAQYTIPDDLGEEIVDAENFERLPCPVCSRKFNGEERLVRV